MRGTTSAAVALVLIAALASSARADDPPGLALAKQVVDEVRGDAHKEKMRIVWPETVEATPPEGAEVVLIWGYIDYELVRFVWHEGRVETGAVGAARTWFYNQKGEAFGAREFDVDPTEFAKSWAAARYVAGARDERIEPEPEDHALVSHGGSVSHESSRYVRMRDVVADQILHCSDPHGSSSNWEYVRPWHEIRDVAVFRLFKRLVAKKDESRVGQPPSWMSLLVGEIRRATSHRDLSYGGEHRLLLEVCLRVVGEFGNAAALDAVASLDAALATNDQGDYAVQRLREETEIATTKLRLSTQWDSSEAARWLRSNPHKRNWQEDLDKWVRRHFRDRDPVGFLDFAAAESDRSGASEEIQATIERLRQTRPPDAVPKLHELFVHADPGVRLAAAKAALAIDAKDSFAAAALLALVDDRPTISSASGDMMRPWRVAALRAAVDHKLLGEKEVRARLADPRPDDAYFVEALLDALGRTSEPPSDAEVLDAWRRMVDGPAEFDVEVAVLALLKLHDTESRERIAAALDRIEAARENPKRGWLPPSASLIEQLRKRLADEMPAPTVPK